MTLAAAFVVPLGIAGDVAGRAIAEHQPLKLAAAEALPTTQRDAPFTVGGIADNRGHVRYGIHLPYALSLLVGRSPRARVTGLAAAPAKDRPPVEVVHGAFDLMVAIGGVLPVVIGAYFIGRWRRPAWLRRRLLLLPVVAAGPLAFVAIEAGWTVTEVGRQPWIVYGLVRTSTTLTTSPLVGLMFLLFAALYATLAAVTVAALCSDRQLVPRRARLQHRSVV
jgi:cytochrome d ubiquinol oxidase subunit I